jgi:DNA-binding LacI/PurR family transcriptional regulator
VARDLKSIGHAAGGLVAQTLVTLADGDHTPPYVGIGRKAPGAKLDLVTFDGGLDAAKAWITKKDKVDAVVVGLDEQEHEVRLLLGSPDATRKYDMICSVRYAVKDANLVAKRAKQRKATALVSTSTIGFLAETPDESVADQFLDSVLAGIYSHARAADLDVGKLGDYDDLD